MGDYYVTRQAYYYADPDDCYAVEIAYGLDNAGPDALAAEYADEFTAHDDPREAAETAVGIAEQWARDIGRKSVPITTSAAASMGVYATPEDGMDADETRAWAEAEYAQAPKCDRCGGIIQTEWRRADDWTGERFCSESCVTAAVEYDEMMDAEIDD